MDSRVVELFKRDVPFAQRPHGYFLWSRSVNGVRHGSMELRGARHAMDLEFLHRERGICELGYEIEIGCATPGTAPLFDAIVYADPRHPSALLVRCDPQEESSEWPPFKVHAFRGVDTIIRSLVDSHVRKEESRSPQQLFFAAPFSTEFITEFKGNLHLDFDDLIDLIILCG